MKKYIYRTALILFVIIAGCFFGSLASAAPFLVCDTYPAGASQPTEFEVFLDGATSPIISPAQAITGGVRLRHDVGTVGVGNHTVTVKAVKVDVTYGRLTSASSAPFAFTRPSQPSTPIGIGLEP